MTLTDPDTSVWEYAARQFERADLLGQDGTGPASWDTLPQIASLIDSRTVQTPGLDVIDAALDELLATPDGRLIITMPPQEGKSSRVARDFPIHVLRRAPRTRIVTGSYAQSLANRNGRAIRNVITAHPELGLRIALDHGSVSEWSLNLSGTEYGSTAPGGVRSVGRGAGITGNPADLLIIDDPLKDRKEADSATIRDACWDWWTDSLSSRLAPGAPVVLILTRWHEDDLAGRLMAAEDGHLWRVLNIPARADHDPAKGETDPLGREPGQYLTSARGRTPDDWEAIRTRVGARTWSALYQGRPSAAEGTMFKREHWRYYERPQWLDRPDGTRVVTGFDDLLISWDLTFKNTDGADYVSGQVWGRRGVDAYLLDRVHARMDFPETVRQVKVLAARWPQAVRQLIEDKANGPAVIASLRREVAGIVPVEPDGGKVARAAAITPLVEAGNVWLPAPNLCPWISAFVDEHAAFPTGVHDDDVDACSQALNRLILQPLLAGLIVTAEQLEPDLAEHGDYVP